MSSLEIDLERKEQTKAKSERKRQKRARKALRRLEARENDGHCVASEKKETGNRASIRAPSTFMEQRSWPRQETGPQFRAANNDAFAQSKPEYRIDEPNFPAHNAHDSTYSSAISSYSPQPPPPIAVAPMGGLPGFFAAVPPDTCQSCHVDITEIERTTTYRFPAMCPICHQPRTLLALPLHQQQTSLPTGPIANGNHHGLPIFERPHPGERTTFAIQEDQPARRLGRSSLLPIPSAGGQSPVHSYRHLFHDDHELEPGEIDEAQMARQENRGVGQTEANVDEQLSEELQQIQRQIGLEVKTGPARTETDAPVKVEAEDSEDNPGLGDGILQEKTDKTSCIAAWSSPLRDVK